MLVVDLSRIYPLMRWSVYRPFMRVAKIKKYTLATYWKTWTGETDSNINVMITQFLELSSLGYSNQLSLANCTSQPQSFYWDNTSQLLYVHLRPSSNWVVTDDFSYGQVQGFCDESATYIGGEYYEPLLLKVPTVSQSLDLVNYSACAFNSGTMTLNNTRGDLDDIIDDPIYGNLVSVYWGPSGQMDIARSSLIPIASYYVEDYNYELGKLEVKLQDRRKEQNAQVCTEYMADGTVVPVVLGFPRWLKANAENPEDAGTPVVFRACTYIDYRFGLTVEVEIEKVWTIVTPTSIDYATGRFTLSSADGREGGNGARACRCYACGHYVYNAQEMIEKLNFLTVGTVFNESNYNINEWWAETYGLWTGVSIAFDSEIKLYDAIAQIQNQADQGFRYEIGADGRRTVRVDDRARPKTFLVHDFDIVDQSTLRVESDASLLGAYYTIKYAKDYNSGRHLTVQDDSQADYVLDTYRQKPTIIAECMANIESVAERKIEWLKERFKDVPRIAKITVQGAEFMQLRLLDTGVVDLNCINQGREYFGQWDCIVIGVAPDWKKYTNKLSLALIQRSV